jgi:phage shock protein C
MQMNRRLYRCRANRRLFGVASGVAEFFGLDPTPVRVLWFLSIFFGGFSVVLYIGLAIIMPLEPLQEDDVAGETAVGPAGHRHLARGDGGWVTFLGIALIILGGLALVDMVLPGWASWRQLWPLLLVGIGSVLVIGALRREPTRA